MHPGPSGFNMKNLYLLCFKDLSGDPARLYAHSIPNDYLIEDKLYEYGLAAFCSYDPKSYILFPVLRLTNSNGIPYQFPRIELFNAIFNALMNGIDIQDPLLLKLIHDNYVTISDIVHFAKTYLNLEYRDITLAFRNIDIYDGKIDSIEFKKIESTIVYNQLITRINNLHVKYNSNVIDCSLLKHIAEYMKRFIDAFDFIYSDERYQHIAYEKFTREYGKILSWRCSLSDSNDLDRFRRTKKLELTYCSRQMFESTNPYYYSIKQYDSITQHLITLSS